MSFFKTAILATGGMDSTALMYDAVLEKKVPLIITVDYGQKVFEIQKKMLSYHIDKLSLSPLEILQINFFDWQYKKGLFTENYIPNEENPLEDWDKLRYSDFFIEGRNLIMLSYALAYCSAHKIDELLVGYLYSEKEWNNRRSYKLMTGDNSPQFVDTMNIMSLMGFSYQVRIRAPFYEQKMSKKDVYELGCRLGINYEKTYSCYFTPECKVCDNCLLRKEIII